MKHYRLIYNLAFIYKLIEKLVARCTEGHIKDNDLNYSYQSAYRIGYSTEIPLLKVHSEIAETLEEGSVTALIMLYLSVIDNSIILKNFLWNLGKSINLGKVVPRRQNSVCFGRG